MRVNRVRGLCVGKLNDHLDVFRFPVQGRHEVLGSFAPRQQPCQPRTMLNPVVAAGTEGFAQFSDVCIGGQTLDGRDATNELSFLILESMRGLQLTNKRNSSLNLLTFPDMALYFFRHGVSWFPF